MAVRAEVGGVLTQVHVLYLTDAFPFPLTSGLLRHYFLIRELSALHRVTLFSRVGGGFDDSHLSALRPFAARTRTFPDRRAERRLRLPFQQESASSEMGRAVRNLFEEDPFQVVVTVKRCAGAVTPDLPVPVVGDICDAASMRIRRSIRYHSKLRLPRLLASYWRMRLLEIKTLRRCAHSLFISPRDRNALLGARSEGTSIIPNGVDCDYWARTSPVLGKDILVFTGAMDYPPNLDAALRLMGPILERVRTRRPGVELWIVGRDPAPEIKRAATGLPGVLVTGWVEDVRPYLDQAAVFCAPLRFGAGAQNKILEALSMEVPCVVSQLAAEGLRTERGSEPPLAVAGDEEQMSRQILALLEPAASGNKEPARAGRDFVRENFQWRQSGIRLNRIVDEVCS